MTDIPNPPIEGVRCGREGCGAEIYRVDRAAVVVGLLGETIDGGEFICAFGHVAGVWINKGELDLGVIRPRVCEDGHPLNTAGRDPRQPDNPWPRTRPRTADDVDG